LEKHRRSRACPRRTRRDHVAFLGLRADDPAPAARLRAVHVQRHALDVAVARDGDHHHLLGDQLLDVEVRVDLFLGELGAPLVAVALLELVEVAADDVHHARFAIEDVLQVGDLGDQLV
jgi:hypothetical protein